MRNFFDRLNYKFSEMMYGRYGTDDFNRFLLLVAIILIFVDFFLGSTILSALTLALMIYALWRSFSKNIAARSAENRKFEEISRAPKAQLSLWSKQWKNRKTTLYFKCKGCGQVLSVPKGKGTLRVVCPKCKTETRKKS